ncbi:MAG: helix-turn-helix domain-containing protein [Thermomicrobiales bacterium]|nr:helix-turn-helix domain-containing protein [Thermomicrobiales bacterium]
MIQRSLSPFGICLRQFREEAALTQGELAERTGLSLRGISDLERGLRLTPRLETVRMLADGLGLDRQGRAALVAARSTSSRGLSDSPLEWMTRVPSQPTSFVGRTREIDAIVATMRTDGVRLLTLTGPGGVGKTRLALEAAQRLVGEFGREVVVIDLSPVRKPEQVLGEIASCLGMLDSVETSPRELLPAVLWDRPLLIVLDNLEHLAEAATDIAWLLASCPNVTVLATSRVVLRIAAEHVLEIEPFALPATVDIDSITHNDAVTLFAARASATGGRFTLTDENAAAVADIVHTLQGIPLAIELAAARPRIWPVSELRRQLDSQLTALTAGAHDAPPRHRTMRDAIAWSYELLASREQEVLRYLSIFPVGCTQQTAIDVLSWSGDIDSGQIIDAMSSLVDSSLVRVVSEADGVVRFAMLQTVREFGLERLAAVDQEEQVRRAAHAAWCIPLARRAEFVAGRPGTMQTLELLDSEWQNLRDHIGWLMTQDDVFAAMEISGCLASYRAFRGFLDDARLELEVLLADERNTAPTRERARALIGMGNILHHADDTARALEFESAGAALARDLGEVDLLFSALMCLSADNVYLGRVEMAEHHVREADDLVISHGWTDQQCIVDLARVFIAEQRGDWDTAYDLLGEGVAAAQANGLAFWEAVGRLSLGYHHIRLGDLDVAEASMLEAHRLFLDIRDEGNLPGVYRGLAEVARLRGDSDRTREMLESALAISRRIGSLRGMAGGLLSLARASLAEGDPPGARDQLLEAIVWFQRCQHVVEAVTCLDVYADIAMQMDRPDHAAWCIGAIDGVLAAKGQARTEVSAGEHECRLARSRSILSPAEWQEQYERGHSLSIDAVLEAIPQLPVDRRVVEKYSV